jgi:diguanylate cyclase (GGDEF)-like protein/putative nucleotidyltransferase with HDIG domain
MISTGNLSIWEKFYYDYIFTVTNFILVLFIIILASIGIKLLRVYLEKMVREARREGNGDIVRHLDSKLKDGEGDELRHLIQECLREAIHVENGQGHYPEAAITGEGFNLVANESYDRDELTGVYKRDFFKKFVREHKKIKGEKNSFLYCDINGLRTVNKVDGYEEGDVQIKMVVDTIKHTVPENSTVFRVGGDEFLVYMPDVKAKDAEEISTNLDDNIKGRPGMKVDLAIGMSTKVSDFQNMDLLITSAEENMQRNKLLNETSIRSNLIEALMNVLGEKSFETEEHCLRIKDYAVKMGEKMGLSHSEMNSIVLLSYLHDIGKVSVPDAVLMKPTKLNKEEWEAMKKHSEIGAKILRGIPDLEAIADAVHAHHENWDGTGYPRGLKKEQVPLIARIIRVVDSYDAMSNARVYSIARPKFEVINEIKRCSGTLYDPEIVDVFMEVQGISKSSGGKDSNRPFKVVGK